METPRDPEAEPPADAVGSSPPPEPAPSEPAPPTGAQVPSVPPSPAQPPAAPAPPAQPPAAPPPASWAPPAEELVGPAPGYLFGGAGERLVAYILDTLIISVLSIILLIAGTLVIVPVPPLGILLWFGILVVWLVYFPWYWVKGGTTLGMRPFNLQVVRDSDGGPIGWGAAIIRLIGLYIVDWIVFGIPIGLLWVFVDKRKRCWHDLLASTTVVKKAV